MKIGAYYAPAAYNISGIAIVFCCIKEMTFQRNIRELSYCIIPYILYFGLFQMINWGASIEYCFQSVITYRNLIIYLLLAFMIKNYLNKGLITSNFLYSTVSKIMIFEAFICILQFFVPSISNFFRIDTFFYKGETHNVVDASFDSVSEKVCMGTVMSSSALSMSFSLYIIYYFIINKDYLSKHLKAIVFYIISLLLVGVRGPLLATIITFVSYYFFNGKKIVQKIAICSCFILASSLLLTYLGDFGSTLYADANRSNPIERALSSAIVFSSSDDIQNTTLGLPLLTIDYFITSPLIGNGLHNSGKGYWLGDFKLEDYSITDAGIVFIIAEYGLIGLLILLYPLYILYKKVDDKKMYIFLCLGIILNSIVDTGIIIDQTLILLTYLSFVTMNSKKILSKL